MKNVEDKIRRLTRYYTKLVGSNDPYIIAQNLGVKVSICPLGNIAGNYKLIYRKRWIFINEDIPENSPFFKIVLAHELGHALLHREENCAFIKNNTLLLTNGIEREANQFAAHLLITDDILQEFTGFTREQFCNCTGYPMELLKLRLE